MLAIFRCATVGGTTSRPAAEMTKLRNPGVGRREDQSYLKGKYI